LTLWINIVFFARKRQRRLMRVLDVPCMMLMHTSPSLVCQFDNTLFFRVLPQASQKRICRFTGLISSCTCPAWIAMSFASIALSVLGNVLDIVNGACPILLGQQSGRKQNAKTEPYVAVYGVRNCEERTYQRLS